jgi:hypothetical protein
VYCLSGLDDLPAEFAPEQSAESPSPSNAKSLGARYRKAPRSCLALPPVSTKRDWAQVHSRDHPSASASACFKVDLWPLPTNIKGGRWWADTKALTRLRLQTMFSIKSDIYPSNIEREAKHFSRALATRDVGLESGLYGHRTWMEAFCRGDDSRPLNSIWIEGYGAGWKTDEFERWRSRIERLAVLREWANGCGTL